MGNDINLGLDLYCDIGSKPRLKILQQSTGKYFHVVDDIPSWEDNGLFDLGQISARSIPAEIIISSTYPNPFNPTTNITFGINNKSHIKISIYDISGREIAELANGIYLSGYHSLIWNADSYSSGVYFLVLQSNGFTQTEKLMLIK